MKKYLISIVVLMCVANVALADSKWFADPERLGEGMVLTMLPDDGVVFAFYSHVRNDGTPPVVSPAPPDALFCDEWNVWFIGVGELADDNTASGKIYYNLQIPSFPTAVDGEVADEFRVGTFYLTRNGEGWDLTMINNFTICNLSLFHRTHTLTMVVAE